MITQNTFYASELQVESLDRFLRLLFALNRCYYKRLLDVKALFPRLVITPDDCLGRLETCAAARLPGKVRAMMLDLVQDALALIPAIYPDVELGLYLQLLEQMAQ